MQLRGRLNDFTALELMFLLTSVHKSDLFLGVADLLEVGQTLLDVRVVSVYLLLVILGLGL